MSYPAMKVKIQWDIACMAACQSPILQLKNEGVSGQDQQVSTLAQTPRYCAALIMMCSNSTTLLAVERNERPDTSAYMQWYR